MVPSIIFDFDGTLAVGHGPVRAYATHVAPVAQARYLERVETALLQFDSGRSGYRDGYDIVGSLAAADGVAAETLQEAYSRSRVALGTAEAPVDTMPRLGEFLVGLSKTARLILATNAPAIGIDQVLGTWGVRDQLAEAYFNIGKPRGLEQLITRIRTEGPILSVGDIAEFDLAPAHALGADTALVGATSSHSLFPATMRGSSLATLRSDIETWAATAASSTTPEPLGSGSIIER